MTNRRLFEEIASKDVTKLIELISKGYEETSEFEDTVLQLSDSLSMLHQAITVRRKDDCKANWKEQVQTYQPFFRVLQG